MPHFCSPINETYCRPFKTDRGPNASSLTDQAGPFTLSVATFFSIVVVEATLWRRLCTRGVRSPKADLSRAKSLDDLSKGDANCSVAYKDRSALCGSSAFQWSRRKPVLGRLNTSVCRLYSFYRPNVNEISQKLDPDKIIQVVDCVEKPLTRNVIGA